MLVEETILIEKVIVDGTLDPVGTALAVATNWICRVPEADKLTCDPENWLMVPLEMMIWLLAGLTNDRVAVSLPRFEVWAVRVARLTFHATDAELLRLMR